MRNDRQDNSLIAFKDNSNVIRGSKSNQFFLNTQKNL